MVVPNNDFINELEAAGAGDVKMCFQCGTCTASCPSGVQTSYRTRKLMRMAQLGMKEEILTSEELWQCTTCYACVERCPRAVPIVDIIITLRNMAVANGKMYENHKKTATALSTFGHTVSINDDVKANRKALGLSEVPPTVLANDKAKADFDKLLKLTGFDKIVE